jgi:uncharacterized membrane protein YccC
VEAATKEVLMANDQITRDRIRLSEVRLDHPQDVMEEITDLFYESADAVARLRERIARLADQIARRFAAEEQSGRYDEALCHAPWLTSRAQELQQQHVQLLEALHGIRRLCDSSDGPVAWWQQVQREFEDFTELLHEHEAAEANLLDDMHPGPAWSRD